ncbi:hypothetical protein G6F35_012672 [Rhizopus arrhizus]|nr:hypothetical protein G6F35_012672 [Rhizopus arrhizus]
MRKSRVLVVQHAGLPRPLHAVHHRGEAVHHHQQGGAAGISARVQFGVDARVVRRVDRIDALLPLRCRQPDIGWHHGVVAHFRNQRGRGQRTVAVDQQPRIGLFDRPGIEPFGQCAGGAGNADVPADVAVQFGLRQAQAGEGTRAPGRQRPATPAARAGRRQPRARPSRWCSIIHRPAHSLASSS